MKKLFALFFLFMSLYSKATHNRSGEIFYKRIAPYTATISGVAVPVYTYSITLITYTDDGPSIADRCVDTIYFGDGQKAAVNRSNGPSGGCNCNTGVACGELISTDPSYKVKKNVFSVVHTYPGVGTYSVAFLDLNRNPGIVNIPNSANEGFYIYAGIRINSNIGLNSSPVITNPPLDRGFITSCFYHHLAAYDADGDSLSYELVPCRTVGGVPITGYTFPSAGTGGTFGISDKGYLTWCTPQMIGEYNVAIKITEWRRPNCSSDYENIGHIVRDMQVIISGGNSAASAQPALTDTCIMAGDLLNRSISSTQINITNVQMLGALAFGSQVPAITNFTASTGLTTMSWQSSCAEAGSQPLQAVLVYSINNTPYPVRAYRAFDVKVAPPTVTIYSVNVATGNVTLHWHNPGCSSNISGYTVYRKPGASSWTHGYCETGVPASSGYYPVYNAGPGDTTFTDNYLQPFANGSNMNYIVTAISKNCQEGFAGNPRSIPIVVGIDGYHNDLIQAEVYPNPSQSNFEVQFGKAMSSEFQLRLCASDGRTVYTEHGRLEGSTLTVEAEHLPTGLYILELQSPGGRLYKKLVKQ